MKTKSINNRITSLVKHIKSIYKKNGTFQGEQTKTVLQNLETDIETTIGLQKDVKNLKSTLKSKKKELEAGVINLKKSSKKIKKARKLDKKKPVPVKVVKKQAVPQAKTAKKVAKAPKPATT